MARVVLAMSGGVDSSVAAHLLLEAGHEVVGVFMRHGEESAQACAVDSQGDASGSPLLPLLQGRADHKQGCCSASDAADARRVADRLQIPFYALNLQKDFRRIIDYFAEEYLAARTPNPCVMCNNWLKFGRLFDYAESVGAPWVATGHYARLADCGGRPAICRGVDDGKDQSYVLFGVAASMLNRMLLPVGDYHKPEIRRIAAQLGLRVAEKRDSQEICFVTSGKHAEFVRERHPDRQTAGEIVTTSGQVVGTHAGIEQFTIGQRKGLGVAMGEPFYVVRISAGTNQVVIGRKEELARRRLVADRCNWHAPPAEQPTACLAKIRYNSPAVPAIYRYLPGDAQDPLSCGGGGGVLEVTFEQPVYGVSPGQAVVCYDGPRVLGGGWIVDSWV